jgi:hypothetical protein
MARASRACTLSRRHPATALPSSTRTRRHQRTPHGNPVDAQLAQGLDVGRAVGDHPARHGRRPAVGRPVVTDQPESVPAGTPAPQLVPGGETRRRSAPTPGTRQAARRPPPSAYGRRTQPREDRGTQADLISRHGTTTGLELTVLRSAISECFSDACIVQLKVRQSGHCLQALRVGQHLGYQRPMDAIMRSISFWYLILSRSRWRSCAARRLGTSRRALSQAPRGCLAGLGTAATMAVANSHAVVGPALAWPGRSALGRVLNQRMTLDSLPQLQHPLSCLKRSVRTPGAT